MNAQNILSDTSQRTYPIPPSEWKYYQQWHNTVFLHWAAPAEKIREMLPPGLEADTFNGYAWISLVAFEVKKMTVHSLPPIPYISNFREINVRTYVTHNGIEGIYMFSIETDKLIEVLLTRTFIGLPYKKSEINKTPNRFQSVNKQNNYRLNLSYKPIGWAAKKTELDYWLTERHALYNYHNNTLYRHDIHHKEWKLSEVAIFIFDLNYQLNTMSLPANPDKTHFCEKIEVLLWSRKAV